jgi:hypothetical protein
MVKNKADSRAESRDFLSKKIVGPQYAVKFPKAVTADNDIKSISQTRFYPGSIPGKANNVAKSVNRIDVGSQNLATRGQ